MVSDTLPTVPGSTVWNSSLCVILIEFIVFRLACSIGFSFSLVPTNGEKLRTDRVLGHEAVVVEGLEQRYVGNPFLREQIVEMMRVESAKRLWSNSVFAMEAAGLQRQIGAEP